MKLWPFSHPLMSQSKNFNPNLFLGRFQCGLSGVTITRSGATPASAVTSPSRILTRPVHGSITRHSDIKSTARSACSRQTRHPTTSLPETKSARSSFGAPLRASRQSQWSYRFVSPSQSSRTLPMSHTLREVTHCEKLRPRYLLIALQPRHVEAPQPAGME